MKTKFAQELYVYARAMQIVGTSVAETLEQLNQSGNPREINSLHELIGSHQFNATGQMMLLIAIMLDATQYVDNREYTDAEVKVLHQESADRIIELLCNPPCYCDRDIAVTLIDNAIARASEFC